LKFLPVYLEFKNMIDLQQIKNYFPVEIRENSLFKKYMLKEYIQLLILDFLSSSAYIEKISAHR